MTPSSRSGAPKAARSSSGAPVAAIAIAVVILGGGVFAALLKKKLAESKPPESPPPAVKPFDDLPPDPLRNQAGSGGSADAPFGSSGGADLASQPKWQEALALAAEGEAAWKLVSEAKAADDRTKLNEHGRLAKDKFGRAMELAAELEEALIARYGESSAAVRELGKTRERWVSRLDYLLKFTGR